MIFTERESYQAYEVVGNIDQYIDYVNLHLYQWSYWPGNEGWDIQSTETDYQNDLKNVGLSDEADEKYASHAFAEFFRHTIYRNFKYKLVNQCIPGKEKSFGLFRNDLSEKNHLFEQ